MSKEFSTQCVSQRSPYVPGCRERNLQIYYSIPDSEFNSDTGVLLIVPGYGGNSNSNVYKKIRKVFPDKYNLIVAQCDYFGWEFMQTPDVSSILRESALSLNPIPKSCKLSFPVHLEEDIYNFNDMGPVQAIDLLNCLRTVTGLFSGQFNNHKIIAYGHSHGAYLAHLCNVFMPRAFSSIVDISAMTFPVYLPGTNLIRALTYNLNTDQGMILTLQTRYEYLAAKMVHDRSVYDLKYWYELSPSDTKIIAFHGADDFMVPYLEKRCIFSGLSNAKFVVVDSKMVDNKVFSSTGHGCGADYLNLFEYVVKNYDLTMERECCVFDDREFETDSFCYRIQKLDNTLKLTCSERMREQIQNVE